ncbi:nicotinate-nucleotide--dimethylbenzimidazole phosphoribosyltransferase [Acidimicrobiaceae bacterium]|nr:nicotinate-nucleotide--dimethylbenzimidazole phosphoribosyltransferase [Acidimicrobiaceae bacterium]
MSEQRFDEALSAGRNAVEQLDADLLVIGEMGIGNTTVAAAITASLLGGEPSCGSGSRYLASINKVTNANVWQLIEQLRGSRRLKIRLKYCDKLAERKLPQ